LLTLWVLVVVAVAVRSLIRFVLIRKPGADDYTILVAMVRDTSTSKKRCWFLPTDSLQKLLSCGYLIEVLVGKANGIGHAMGTLSMDNMTNLIKVPRQPPFPLQTTRSGS